MVSIDSPKETNSPMLQKENEVPVGEIGEGPLDQTLVTSIEPPVMPIQANQHVPETPSLFSASFNRQGWTNSDEDGAKTGWPPGQQGKDPGHTVLRLSGGPPISDPQVIVEKYST